MSITQINPTNNLTSGFGASPQTIAITTPTSGNMFALFMQDSAGLGGLTVTDNQSNVYTEIYAFTDNNGQPTQMLRSNNLTGTMPTQLSISWGGGGNRSVTCCQMIEMSGVNGTTPVGAITDSGNVYDTTNSVTFTTANANEAAFCFAFSLDKDYAITESGFSRLPTGVVRTSMIYKADLGAAGSGKTLTRTWTGAGSADMVLVTFIPAASGGQQIAVGQAAETNLAQTIAVVLGALIIGLGQPSEVDAAQTITPYTVASVAVGQAQETDFSQPVTVVLGNTNVAAGQAIETDLAQVITPSQATVIAVGRAVETDLSQAITAQTGVVIIPVGQVTETDLSQTITAQQGVTVALGQVAETDVAQPITPVALGTVARPNADTTPGAWLPSTGTVLYDMVDEVVADDADYIYATTASTCNLALSPVADPLTSSGQVVSYRAWSPAGNGLIVRLKQGAITIATWTHSALPTNPTTYQQVLSGAECDAITDYTALSTEMEATI